ncbi:alpha/beta fold hydrolase [Bradyrhizobium sp. SRL28]|uniref:alpha/beta fold hydrolase n=1 Tax=Bradyrhizobium sp. SRL28 TaxID=2836178 RepID=UPI001BDE655B|nr:alpha/beta fold hydrolase [Bradyrhizobium sp. SRL28]MBT1517502.1 alpha/beta fold hydrolase [Bradyrhizobium sp. SRL28]
MAHPPLAPGWIDAPHHVASLGRLPLESGDAIDDLRISYVVHGSLNDRAKPVIFGLCAIGSTHHRLDFLIGPGRALDPSRHTIVVIDALGNGLSSSPSNSPMQPGERFPRFTIRDMVTSQRMLASHLRIDAAHAIVGASMGGMQALQWGVSHPDFAARLVALVPMAKTTPWSQAINRAGRLVLANARDLPTPEARWGSVGHGDERVRAALAIAVCRGRRGRRERRRYDRYARVACRAHALDGCATARSARLDLPVICVRCARCRHVARVWRRHAESARINSSEYAHRRAVARSV